MDDIAKDPRFAHTLKDPRFRQPKLEYSKTKVDARFKRMLTDERFSDKYTVDKRGRPINTSAKEELDRLYDLESEDENEPEESGEENVEEEASDESMEQSEDEKKGSDEKEDESQGAADSDSDSDIPKVTEDGPDYARGAALMESSSSDEEVGEEGEGDEDDDLDEEALLDHHWNELDRDAPMTEESTHRLAVVKMDWDRIKAKDIFVLCNSFVPQGGAIESVTIYPSEEGMQRMAEEALKGPKEFREAAESGFGKGAKSKDIEQALRRKYQLQRLNYFYGVVVCDSVATADKIYEECNGLEYQKSCNQVDLRFIPDDMTFDQQPRETCTGIKDMSAFKPSSYKTSALSQERVDVTWDETDVDRLKKTLKQFTEEDCENNEGADLIASEESSSDSEEETAGKKTAKTKTKDKRMQWREAFRQSLNLDDDTGKKKKKKKKRDKNDDDEDDDKPRNEKKKKKDKKKGKKSEKGKSRDVADDSDDDEDLDEQFANLISKIENKKKSQKTKNSKSVESDSEDEDLQLLANDGMKKNKPPKKKKGTESLSEDENDVSEEQSEDSSEGEMEYKFLQSAALNSKLKKSSTKKKLSPWEAFEQKKKEKKKEKKKRRKTEKLKHQGVQDTTDLGFDDPFFADEPEMEVKKKKKKERRIKKKKVEEEEEDEESKKQSAALELLMNAGEEKVEGFSLLKLMKEEKDRQKKKGKKRRQAEIEGNMDNVEVQVDSRFSRLFTDPELHIDPNIPDFKKTSATLKLMEEVAKKKRAKLNL